MKQDGTSAEPRGPGRGGGGAQPETDLQTLRGILEPKYSVQRLLGRGGMAEVYLGFHNSLKMRVAIKVLPRRLAMDRELVRRFMQEAESAARLKHPNIINIYDIGTAGPLQYFIMEYLPGGSLGEKTARLGRLAVGEATELVVRLCDALSYAHGSGVIHRDIKPDNILFDEHGNPVLTDFGIAKAVAGSSKTATGVIVGTPRYMSPERLKGMEADQRGDIYSLGVLFYQILTGRLPFEAEDNYAVGLKHIQEDPTPPRELAPQIPEDLNNVVLAMMAKDPADRFASAELVRGALLPHVSGSFTVGESTDREPGSVEASGPAGAEGRKRMLRQASEREGRGGEKTEEVARPQPAGTLLAHIERLKWPLLAAGVVLLVVVVAILPAPAGGPAAGPREPEVPEVSTWLGARTEGDYSTEAALALDALLAQYDLIYLQETESDGEVVRSLGRLGSGHEPEALLAGRPDLLAPFYTASFNSERGCFHLFSATRLLTVAPDGDRRADKTLLRDSGNVIVDAQWTDDASRVALLRRRKADDVYELVYAGTSAAGDLGSFGVVWDRSRVLDFSFSPGAGQLLAFACRIPDGRDGHSGAEGIYIVSWERGEPQLAISTEPDGTSRIAGISWSPAGDRIYYLLEREGVRGFEIFSYNLESGQIRSVAVLANRAPRSRLLGSPDGRLLCFDSAGERGCTRIYCLFVGGGRIVIRPTLLTPACETVGSRTNFYPLGWTAHWR